MGSKYNEKRGGGWLMPMPKIYDLPTVKPHIKEIVPRNYHMVHLVKPNGTYPFTFIGLLSVLSVLKFGKPKRIYIHWSTEKPSGKYWNAAIKAINKKRIDLIYEEYDWGKISVAPNGVKFHYTAGISDIVRISALIRYGGVYLDQDILILKDISELFHYPFVSGIEKTAWYVPWAITGLLSAFLISEKNASFANRWYEIYATQFSKPLDYNKYAIRMPWQLAKMQEFNDIHVLPFTATAFPLYTDAKIVFDKNEYRYIREAYVLHLWDSLFKKQLKPYNDEPLLIFGIDNLFTSVARMLISRRQTLQLSSKL